MTERKPMKCPRCGVQMNAHAERLLEPRSLEEARSADPILGGVVEECFSCPGCGWAASRPLL